ncbi:hypothetical protein E2C01_054845 [Portunus trituberculatus]|uniref:Uncharacterized protein n=1 Tax=Portunus trituberculatus TaxID=210409 RepID=A0A5B7GV13_PORTR|nr:hypothetical protein [Portunus trituberculatus]
MFVTITNTPSPPPPPPPPRHRRHATRPHNHPQNIITVFSTRTTATVTRSGVLGYSLTSHIPSQSAHTP